MPSDKEKLTVKGLVARILEPPPSVRDSTSRQQAYLTALVSLILSAACFIGLIVSVASGAQGGLSASLFILTVIMSVALAVGRTDNFQAGSIIMVAGMVVGGYALSASFPNSTVLILLATVIPALILGSLLIPVVAIIIIAVLKLISIGTLPLMAIVDVNTGLLLFVSFFIIDAVFIATSAFRENIENRRLEELEDLRGRLEERLGERTRTTRIAADIAQDVASSSTIEELVSQAASLIASRLGFNHVSIYLADEASRLAVLSAAHGTDADKIMQAGKRIEFGSPTLISWVVENKQPRVMSRVVEDPLHLEAELLPESQSEIGIPILSRDQVLGILNVQSTKSNAFDNETIVVLEMLANQIATAIQNVRLFESEQGSVQEVAEVYRAGYRLAEALSEEDINRIIAETLSKTSYVSMYLVAEKDNLRVQASADVNAPEGLAMPEAIEVSVEEISNILASGPFIGEGGRLSALPYTLVRVLRQLRIFSIALIPVVREETLSAVLLVGTRERRPLSDTNMQPFVNVATLIAESLERMQERQLIERRIVEMETITLVSQEVSSIRELTTLYRTLHGHIRQALGDVNFLVAIYDASTNSISVPYMFEKGLGSGDVSTIETYPLGEGLTSILIRTKQPLMLIEDVETRAAALGARLAGKAAKSWLGAPLIVSGEVIGAVVVQDMDREYAFADSDMRFLTTLSAQVAGAIFNARLLEETASRAVQLQTAAEIARDISGSLDLGELLNKAVTLIRDRFSFYHAAIFLVDAMNEFATIREATGDAGMEMKRAGHKLKVGSKSIVGFVTGSGEPLIVNDTSRDATYYANPLLPDTRAEVAIPLKIGARVLGVLDVQSTQAYSFSEEDVSVLRILADQLAVAVINSELFADTQEHLSQHRLLHHVTTAAASGTTLEEALNSAAQGLQVTLGGDRVIIMLADKERQVLTVKAFAGYSEEVGKLEVAFGEGITGWVAANLQPQRINDVTLDPRYMEIGSNVRSELVVPLTYRGELLGVLNVESDEVGAYNENDEEMLGTLGGSLAAVIANARLIEQVRRQVDRERMLYEVTSKIRRSTDMQTIMATTTSELGKALGARRAQIKIEVADEPGQANQEKSQ